MTPANVVTLLRIALIPVFGILWWRGAHGWALAAFAAAGASDLLDGFLARVLDQRTRLGQLLDPAADKLLLLVSFLVAAALGAVPRWLAALVIGRDLLLMLGSAVFAFWLKGRFGPERWTPTRLGKYATFTQLLTIGLALVSRAAEADRLGQFVGAFVLVSAVLTAIAGAQYLVEAVRAMSGDSRGAIHSN
jgi:cardiolipin synthase